MSTPTDPKPYTPQQVLNNLKNFVDELDQYPTNEQSGPGYVLRQCENILGRGIESPTSTAEINLPPFTLRRCPNGMLWLQRHDGEGMEVNEASFTRILSAFFTKHF